MQFYNTYVQETPNGLKTLPKPNWFYDDGTLVDDSFLATEGIYPVVDVTPTVDDPRFQYAENEGLDGLVKVDGAYHAQYTLKDQDYVVAVAENAKRIKGIITDARGAALEAGFTYDFSGVQQHVQTRDEDKANLIALNIRANSALARGDTSPLVIQTLENQTQYLSPTEMVALTEATFGYIESVYLNSWARKAAVDTLVANYDGTSSPTATLDALDAV